MLGSCNYTSTDLGTSIPEITDIEENEDGTVTLTVDGVSVFGGTDKAITHQLTVRFTEDGGIRYLSNQVTAWGLESIPEYKYRLGKRHTPFFTDFAERRERRESRSVSVSLSLSRKKDTMAETFPS